MPAYATNMFTLFDQTDPTKQMRFSVASLTTATLAIMSVPYTGSGTFVIAEHTNSFSGQNLFLTDSTTGLVCHRQAAGSTGNLFVCENQVGQALLTVNKNGDFLDSGTGGIAIVNTTDITKILTFDCSAISPGNTRSMTMPDTSGTVALDTSILTYNGDVLTYDDDLLTI